MRKLASESKPTRFTINSGLWITEELELKELGKKMHRMDYCTYPVGEGGAGVGEPALNGEARLRFAWKLASVQTQFPLAIVMKTEEEEEGTHAMRQDELAAAAEMQARAPLLRPPGSTLPLVPVAEKDGTEAEETSDALDVVRPYGGPDAHLFPPRKHLTPPRKLTFFGHPARDFASLIPSTSFARTACSAPRDFGPARAKIQTSARAQIFFDAPQKNSLDEQRYDGDRQRQAVLPRLGFAWINQRDGYGMAELPLSIPLTPVNVFVFFRAD
ncbi:hypothetical protein B0H11DRAFT_1937767 [Mycena galericulata]|nr:hypothetical protein B0H11DRAFT_1937767 [Mycena galericulata]